MAARHNYYGLESSLTTLGAIVQSSSSAGSVPTRTVVELYLRIYAQCLAPKTRVESQKRVREFCVENRAVLCPNSVTDYSALGIHWHSPDDCVWDAPADSMRWRPIRHRWAPVAEAQRLSQQDCDNLEGFFRQVLLIQDLTISHIMGELRHVSGLCRRDPTHSTAAESLHNAYRNLLGALMKETDDSVALSVRRAFETEELIFVSSGQSRKWFKSSECVWLSVKTMQGPPCLEQLYPDLAGLFVNYLAVPKTSIRPAYEQLLEFTSIATGFDYADYAKSLLWSLNELLIADSESPPSFKDAVHSRVFPVILPNGDHQMLTALDSFAINDREHYALHLRGRIKLLDFSMEDIRKLRPFIKWAGLSGRYLSQLVTEKTEFEGIYDPEKSLKRDLVRKASAFVSIASHFDSPFARNPDALHAALGKIRVFVVQTIIKVLEIQQDGRSTTVELNACDVHLESPPGAELDFYLPSDEDERDFCIASRLLPLFSARLMDCKSSEVDPRIINIISSIIHAKPANMSRILEVNGITELSFPATIEIDDEPSSAPGQVTSPTMELHRPSTPVQPTDRILNGGGRSPLRRLNASPSSPLSPRPQQGDEYEKLLAQVVKEARRLDLPPYYSSPGINSSDSDYAPESDTYRFWTGRGKLWREMVGAAGELFVFELLSSLKPRLPGFGRHCWRSQARQYAKEHPEYRDIKSWEGDETGVSDILYRDQSGVFTNALVKRGYLKGESCHNVKPTYHIEVKATTRRNHAEEFYMGKRQYEKMQKLAINDQLGSCTWQEIYVVFRVYGLNSGKIGVKIYVDPEAARKDGRLQFEPADERWKVTPGKPQPQAEAQAQVTVQSQSVTTTTTTGRNSWRLSSHGVSTCAQPPVSGLRLMEI